MSCPNHDATTRNPACQECNPALTTALPAGRWAAARTQSNGPCLIGYGERPELAMRDLYEREAEQDSDVCPRCGDVGYMDEDGSCRSAACESDGAE